MKKEKIISVLIYIITIATLIAIVYFQKNLTKVAWATGIGASLAGLLAIIKKDNYGYLVFSFGFSLLLSAFFYSFDLLDKSGSFTFMFCSSIFMLMCISLIKSVLLKQQVEDIYDVEVEATVVDLEKNPNTKKDYYQVIYEYVIGKNLYTVASPYIISNFLPKIGTITKIKISSKDPANVYFEKRLLDKLYEKGLTIGLIIVTLAIIITLFI